jgi:hypothetical protein
MNRKAASWTSDRSKVGLRVEAKNGLLVQAKGGFYVCFHVIVRGGLEKHKSRAWSSGGLH